MSKPMDLLDGLPPGLLEDFHALDEREQRFALEYGHDRDATQAAIRAGYTTLSAPEEGSKLLKNELVRALVDALRPRHLALSKLDRSGLAHELKRLILADLRDAFDPDGKAVGFPQWPADLRAGVASLRLGPGKDALELKDVKFEKLRSLALFMRHYKTLRPRRRRANAEEEIIIIRRLNARGEVVEERADASRHSDHDRLEADAGPGPVHGGRVAAEPALWRAGEREDQLGR